MLTCTARRVFSASPAGSRYSNSMPEMADAVMGSSATGADSTCASDGRIMPVPLPPVSEGKRARHSSSSVSSSESPSAEDEA